MKKTLNNQNGTVYSTQQIIFSLVKLYLNIFLLTLNMEVTRSFETMDLWKATGNTNHE